MADYTCVPISGPYELGEGPHWDERTHSLYFVDAFAGNYYKLNTTTTELEEVHMDGVVTVIVPWEGKENTFIVSREKEILQLNWQSKETKLLAAVEPGPAATRFNDGKCDRNGRLWIGSMGIEVVPTVVEPDLGSLYSFDNELKIKQQSDKVSLSNGMLWSLDNQHMYFVDSAKRQVYVFDYDCQNGSVSNKKVFFDFDKHCKKNEFPDGMTIDADDKLWIACYGGGRIIRVDPQTQAILKSVEFANVSKITSACFGGPRLNKLFVTSAFKGLNDAEKKAETLAGSLFEVNFEKENIRGLNADRFVSV